MTTAPSIEIDPRTGLLRRPANGDPQHAAGVLT